MLNLAGRLETRKPSPLMDVYDYASTDSYEDTWDYDDGSLYYNDPGQWDGYDYQMEYYGTDDWNNDCEGVGQSLSNDTLTDEQYETAMREKLEAELNAKVRARKAHSMSSSEMSEPSMAGSEALFDGNEEDKSPERQVQNILIIQHQPAARYLQGVQRDARNKFSSQLAQIGVSNPDSVDPLPGLKL